MPAEIVPRQQMAALLAMAGSMPPAIRQDVNNLLRLLRAEEVPQAQRHCQNTVTHHIIRQAYHISYVVCGLKEGSQNSQWCPLIIVAASRVGNLRVRLG